MAAFWKRRHQPSPPDDSWTVCFAGEWLECIDEHAERFGVERHDVVDRAFTLLRFWSNDMAIDERLAILSPDGTVRVAMPVWSDQIRSGLGEVS